MELADALEAAVTKIGPLPICPEWTYSSIRHCQRNMDFDVSDGFYEPDRQCGGSIAEIVNLVPQIIKALRGRQLEREKSL